MISDVLSRVTSSRLRSGGDLSQIVAEIGELRQPVTAIFDGARDAAMVPTALVTAAEVVGALRVAAVVALLNESDEAVARQRQELLETTTPVIRLWEGIVAVPLIGTLDSNRSQVVMESLLNGIVEEQAEIAILDITGVPMVDTLVAQHLMKTAMAVRLMGAECVISGIRPQIAQTIVALGIDLGGITTRATLSDALKYGLEQTGVSGPVPGVRLVIADSGPGIADIGQALTDGHTTGHGLGLGLGGARRLVDDFSIESAPGRGTTVTIVMWACDARPFRLRVPPAP